MNTKVILTMGLQQDKQKAIEKLAKGQGIRIRDVKLAEYKETLGYLCGIVGFAPAKEKYKGMPFPSEMMIFSGMPQPEVEAFLDSYNKMGPAPVGLKAMVTPSNITWTPEHIFGELMQEHLFFRK